MELKIKLSPLIKEGKTKQSILNTLKVIDCYGTCGNYYTNSECSGYAIVINFQKFNKKSKVMDSNHKLLFSQRIKIRDSHWKAYIYFIPMHLLGRNKLKVIQDNRNFKIISK